MKLLLALATLTLAGCSAIYSEPVATDTVIIPGPWIFQPETIVVDQGTTVTWINEGGADHTVTIDGILDETIKPGEKLLHTFDEPGTFRYACKLHPPGMVGTVTVLPRGKTNTTTEVSP
jgi:plastocyanin